MNFLEPCSVNLYSMLRCQTIALAAVAFLTLLGSTGVLAEPVRHDHLSVQLATDRSMARPGDTITVALHFSLDPDWHLYWTNPGDAGLAPRVKWTLPEGFTAGALQFPLPERIPAGPLMSFGYEHELVLLSEIAVPADAVVGKHWEFSAEVDWLVCKSECIPGDVVLTLGVDIGNKLQAPDPVWSARFEEARSRSPISDPAWNVAAIASASQLSLRIAKDPSASNSAPIDLYFYPEQKGIIDNAAPQRFAVTNSGYELTIPRNKMNGDTLSQITGILVATNNWVGNNSRNGLKVVAPVEPISEAVPVAAAVTDIAWWQAILFAFVGGIILNLMPCVLPVLSIKVLGFIQQAGESRKKVASHNLAFTLGVLVSFWILAGGLLVLRAGGEQLGWGFQLQSPAFLVVLSSFIFLIGLNLLGVFEVGTTLTGVGAGSRRSGTIGSFVTGITATVVATPCTAPFMGSALGYSLTQPVAVSLAIFTALALGMAAPYVLLTSSPILLKFVPKPGRWMESLKHAMGFLLIATVIWLAWVLSIQSGPDSILVLLAALLLIGVAAWILGRWGGLTIDRGRRLIAQSLAVIIVVLAVTAAATNVPQSSASYASTANVGELNWEPFSPERVAEVRGEGKPLLIDFTAAWCLSCKVNERVAFGSSDVQDKLDKLEVVTMKADWTSRDERITQALAKFGRNSVPLYVLYTGKSDQPPVVLPEILTPGIVLDALSKLEG